MFAISGPAPFQLDPIKSNDLFEVWPNSSFLVSHHPCCYAVIKRCHFYLMVRPLFYTFIIVVAWLGYYYKCYLYSLLTLKEKTVAVSLLFQISAMHIYVCVTKSHILGMLQYVLQERKQKWILQFLETKDPFSRKIWVILFEYF